MHDIEVTIDFGSDGGGVIRHFFKSESTAKAIISQANADGFITLPAGATSSMGGRAIGRETHFPVARVISVS